MKINRNNYESFFLDYIEGNLSQEMLAELEIFISENPDLKEELKSFETIELKAEDKSLDLETNLTKKLGDINKDNFEEYCIAKNEGDLDEKQEVLLREFVSKNPSLNNILKTYKKVSLKQDIGVVFKRKHDLTKSVFDTEVNEINLDDYCIAYFEKQLNTKQSNDLLAFIKLHPQIKEDFDKYQKVYLKADRNIQYENKNELIKKKVFEFKPQHFLRYASAAAAILIMFFVVFNYKDFINKPAEKIAEAEVKMEEIKSLVPNQEQIASNEIDGNKSKAVTKEKIKEQTKSIIENKSDSIKSINNKPRNLKPLIINSGQNFQFSYKESVPNIESKSISIAKVEFNQDVKPDLPQAPKSEKDYLTLNEFVVNRFKKAVLGDKYSEEKEITYLDLAQVGISGINKLTHSKIDFQHEVNKEGEIEYFALNTKYLAYSKKNK